MSRMVGWIDRRFPLSQFIKKELTGYPTPRNLSSWWNFGFLAGFVLLIQVLSGVFLAMHYKPDAHLAFGSVEHIMREVNYGWLIRYMHSTGGSAFFAIIYIHMARSLYYACYHKPRELMWWSGQVLLLMLMATAFMGYLLPWGQMSYWGAQVITNLFRATPFFGDQIVVWLRGGFTIGDDTLSRFFVLHYLFPFLIMGVVFIHLIALHYVKSSNPTGIDLAKNEQISFHPYFTIKDLYGLGLFLIIYCYFVFFSPDFFIEANNNIPANPLKTPSHIEPEWYFLPFYAVLRSIPDLLGGVIAMTLSVMIFAALPFLDRSKIPGGGRYRPVYRCLFYLFVVDILVLGYVGSQPPNGILMQVGQAATFIYFLLFTLLPFISKREEKWLLARGLPPAVQTFMEEEAARESDRRQS